MIDMHFCVPSLGRANTSKTLSLLKQQNLLSYTYIFVYDFEYVKYKNVYPSANIIKIEQPKNLANKRNKILEYAQKNNFETILMLDDDISYFYFKDFNNKKYKIYSLKLIYEYLQTILLKIKDNFFGIGTRYNFISAYDMSKNIFSLFALGCQCYMFYIPKLKCYYDTNQKFEDVDFFINNTINKNNIVRINNLQVIANSMGKNKGGLQNYITVNDRVKIGMKEMYKKWIGSNLFQPVNNNTGMPGFKKKQFVKWLIDNKYYNEEEINKIEHYLLEMDKKLRNEKIETIILKG